MAFDPKAAAKFLADRTPLLRRWMRRRESARTTSDAAVIRNSGLFEEDWYRARYRHIHGADPVLHYLRHGAAERLNPSRFFSTAKYLKNYPDVVATGVNPFLHYVQRGRFEGRDGLPDDYEAWVACYDTLTEDDLAVFRAALGRFSRRPLISILMPVCNTADQWLTRAIESVIAQVYPDWQLCVSGDVSTEPHVREILERYRAKDDRICLVYRDANGNISSNVNSAFALATGEYISLLDCGDELRPHALFWVVNEILGHPDADVIYSDEDRLDAQGRRSEPYFKPDWNPALILSSNYVSHLTTYRRGLVERVGAFRGTLDGSPHHDLLLRCTDASAPERIRHVPRVLYHWRSVPESTGPAQARDAKPDASRASAAAIGEHLQRNRLTASVQSVLNNRHFQIDYRMGGKLPRVSIIVPTTGNLDVFQPCTRSLFARTTYPDFELLIAINKGHLEIDARRRHIEALQRDPRVRILVHDVEPYSFAAVNNQAAAQATGAVLCFLNDDIEVLTPDWLEKLVARLQIDTVGAVGPILYYPDGSIQHAGVVLGIGGVAAHIFQGLPKRSKGYFGRAALEQDLSCVTAACMVINRQLFDDVGRFDERLAIAFNDVDLCIRLRALGRRILWTPQVEMVHHESASLGRHDSPERRAQFKAEVELMRGLWGDTLDNDPFYNPNLTLEHAPFALAFPPRIAKLPR